MHSLSRLLGSLAIVLFATTTLADPAATRPAAAPEPPKNLLFFGNSYTYTQDTPALLKSLAVAKGHPAPNIVADLKGGSNLARHRTQATKSPASNVAHPSMAGKSFDFVVIQGHSHDAFDRAPFIDNAQAIFMAVRNDPSRQGAAATAILFQTWASAGSVDGSQKSVADTCLGAAKAIVAAADKNAARIAPVGEAFKLLNFDKSLYKPDGSHPGPKGGILSAMVLYRTIYTGETIGNLAYADVAKWAKVTEAEWAELAAAADRIAIPAVSDPAATRPASKPARDTALPNVP